MLSIGTSLQHNPANSTRLRRQEETGFVTDYYQPVRAQHPQGLFGTKPGTLLKNQIPIRTTHWDITLPGFIEADTVAHRGNSLTGDFVRSLILSDILTGCPHGY